MADAAPGEALDRALTESGRARRHRHFEGDGRTDRERPTLRLGGAALIAPGGTGESRENCRAGCERLGVGGA